MWRGGCLMVKFAGDVRNIRTFDTGASRDGDKGKLDYEGFLSPLVLERYAQYMHDNRRLSDGSLRDSDNWQRGFPRDVYMQSAWRHFMDWWAAHRGLPSHCIETALCALMFNLMGYLHEILVARNKVDRISGSSERLAPLPPE